MPIFYNTSTPTPTTKNTITDVATNYGVRDFLLNLNLLPTYPQISTSLNGSPKIGEPVLDTLINNGSNVIPLYLPLETNGILFKDINISINTFQNGASTANDLTSMYYINAIPNVNFPNSIWPQGTQDYPTTANQEVNDYGLIGKTTDAQFRKKNVIKNLYLDVTKQIDMADFINLNPLDISRQVSGYLDTYGSLNLGGSGAIQAANIIGSVITGQGLGLSKGGVVPNFDIRSSLAGRILGATGIITDTKLGNIGGQQLALALANNAAFNVQQEILGSLNVQNNILSLIKGDGLVGLRPSYKITIPSSVGGRILDTAGKILGFTIPRSYLEPEGSIFQTENNGVGNIERANSMILNTGKGQIEALLKNIKTNQIGTNAGGSDDPSKSLFRSGYAPAFANNKGQTQITDALVYAFSKNGAAINLFGSTDGIIADLTYLREEKVSEAGFKSPEEQLFVGYQGGFSYNDRKISDIGFSWGTEMGGLVNSNSSGYEYAQINIEDVNKKSLLSKTQKLFNSKGMRNIVTNKGDIGKKSSQIETVNGNGISKGNAVLKKELFDLSTGRYSGGTYSAEDTYCRSWTTLDRYDTVSKMVRSHGLWDSNNVPYRLNTENSVLGEYGFPKIAPYANATSDTKKFMFSIENLAWSDEHENLPECEVGPGDLLSGKKGRIMWFPPYDIQFSENSSVSWEANNFIGRGESVYTYNNTERSGNLSFKIVVDHPSYVNSFRGAFGPDDNYVNSFWAGCIDPNSEMGKKLTVSERSVSTPDDLTIPVKKNPTAEKPPGPLSVYFPNDNAEIYKPYENGLIPSTTTPIDYLINKNGAGEGLGSYKANFTPGNHNNSLLSDGEGWPDRYNYGLNYSQSGTSRSPETKTTIVGADDFELRGYFDPNTDVFIIKHLTEICPHCVATITGYASEQGSLEYNDKLAKARAEKIKEDIKQKWWPSIKAALPKLIESDFDKRFKIGETKQLTGTGCKPCPPNVTNENRDILCPTDTLECKQDRRATINFEYSSQMAEDEMATPPPIIKKRTKTINTTITNRFYTECNYFEQLTDNDPFVFDSFREKIRYFHPAFHSTTPEGLNSRLTFLLQCTRQGKTNEGQGANNLAFGRAPVCILRIGDFYNTKIIIDNVSIDYEPLVWDLNPEGVGVQPMIANVSMAFKFIGGSTLMGPLNKLQNALSFNYFANSQVYDPRADYISIEKPLIKDKDGKDLANSPTGYYLRNLIDESPYNGDVKKYIEGGTATNETITDNTPEIDQEKANEIAISSSPDNAPSTETTIDDKAVIGCFGYDGCFAFDQTDPTSVSLNLRLNWNATKDIQNPALNKTYEAFIYIINDKKGKRLVGLIKIRPNSADTLVYSVYGFGSGQITPSSIPSQPKTSTVIGFVGQQDKNKILLHTDVDIDDDDELTKFIIDAWNGNGGSIEIVWQVEWGGKIYANFTHLNVLTNN